MAWKKSGDGTAVMLADSADGGKSWSTPRVLAQTKHGSDHPILVSAGGEALLSWFSADEGYRVISLSSKLAVAGPAPAPGR
jgi:hypothetical protein